MTMNHRTTDLDSLINTLRRLRENHGNMNVWSGMKVNGDFFFSDIFGFAYETPTPQGLQNLFLLTDFEPTGYIRQDQLFQEIKFKPWSETRDQNQTGG